jgi:hypothetical protein
MEEYLRECSLNWFTREKWPANIEIAKLLKELSRFTFLMPDDTGEFYSLEYEAEKATDEAPNTD